MYSKKFIELRKAYQAERHTRMNDDQFAALLYTFPSILVAQADGKVDNDEKKFMRDLPEVLTESASENSQLHATLTDDYFKEMEYIVSNLGQWEQPFLEALKNQLSESTNERNAIFQSMWRTADSSEDISEAERKKIMQISQTLGL